MKKFLNFFVLAGVLAIVATSCYKDDIDNLQKQIDALKSGEIATIETQISSINTSITELKSVDNTLKEYITALQSDSKKYAQQIAELTAMDKTLETKIADIQKYVDSEIKDTKDWASATFATLDQMDSVATVVAKVVVGVKQISENLDSLKKEVTGGYTKAIEAAMTKLETSMKKWVSEQLADYYTIAQINATLDSLGKKQSDIDSAMVEKIKEQKVALDTAKSQITAAYKKAIQVAIDSLQGKFDIKIATEIATAKNALQTQIDTISGEISNIKSRLAAAENNIAALLAQIQSVRVIPQYSDGSVELIDAYDTISFNITPATAAQALANAWKGATDENRAKMVSFKIQEVMTKGTAPTAVIDTVFCENGEFKVYAQFQNLPDNAAASLVISSGKSDLSSEYFNLYQYHNYFYFEALEAGAQISMTTSGDAPAVNLQYSTNGSTWNTFIVGTTSVTLANVGDKVYFRAGKEGNTRFIKGNKRNYFEATQNVNIGGNIMYLLNGSYPSVKIDSSAAFSQLFRTNEHIKSASKLLLPALTLSNSCYSGMFAGCSALTEAPALPATTLTVMCYDQMFSGCSSLVSAPSLPATTLAVKCYNLMLKGCSSLTSAPALNATDLEDGCYHQMFINCGSLISAPELPATELASNCYYEMFEGCAKLSSVTMLATDVSAENCLKNWLKKAGTDGSVTSKTLIINASLNPNDTTGAVKTINENSAGWDITNGTKALYAYESFGYGIDIDGVVWAPVNCGYDSTNYKFGKLYQWGRKDGCGYNDGETYEETIIQAATPGPVSASSEDSSKFYTVDGDWLTPQDSTRWNSNTEWPGKEISPTKTNYDPCPTGWRVPTEAELKDLTANKSSWTSKDSQNGYWFSGSKEYSDSAPRVFLPAAGTRYFDNSEVVCVGRNYAGYYWSSSQYYNEQTGKVLIFISSEYFYLGADPRANGSSVRCVKETAPQAPPQ